VVEESNKSMDHRNLSLEEVLRRYEASLIKTKANEELSEETINLIRELGERELVTNYFIVKVLLERVMTSGVVEELGRKELLTILPWKKTRLTERVKKLVEEGIVLTKKRKYSLNLEEPFVARVKQAMRIEGKEVDLQKLLEEFSREKQGKAKEEQREQANSEKETYQQVTEKEFRTFIKETFEQIMHNMDQLAEEEQIEELKRYLKRNILKTVRLTSKKGN